jgi:hypothetical protein
MRRSRALVVFGVLGAVLAVGTAKAKPLAAARAHGGHDGAARVLPRATSELDLGPGFLGHDVVFRQEHERGAIFGSLVRAGAQPSPSLAEGACGPDMVEVEGDYCPLVTQTCLRWLDPETKLQCAEFAPPTASAACALKTQHKHFCIDRYEWPNRVRALPRIMVNYGEAKASCESVGKRLCSDTEWTLACEGPERHPYPYGGGYVRDGAACNIDEPYIDPRPDKLYDAKTQDEEISRLDQRESSGSRTACVSPYGVHDMVGNVDEWVHNVSQAEKPYASGLKGGYWGPVRTRCRPMTTAHDEVFRYYQIGFRCCGGARVVEAQGMPLAER